MDTAHKIVLAPDPIERHFALYCARNGINPAAWHRERPHVLCALPGAPAEPSRPYQGHVLALLPGSKP